MIARSRCRTCREVGRFDVGDVATVDEAQAKLDAAHIQSCPFGHHVELSDIGYEVLELQDGAAPTMDVWRADMVGRGYDLWTTEQLRKTEIKIESFALGLPLARVRGQEFTLDFVTAPNGERYWYAAAGAYAEAIGEAATQATPPSR